MISSDVAGSTILDHSGNEVSFASILQNQSKQICRILVIFIRHFFCGNCQEYVRRLSSDLSPEVLPQDLSIIIIGCGASSLIQSYVEVTKCKYPIYADPSTNLYRHLGMHRSLSLGPKGPAYIRHSLASGMVKSIVQGLKRIPTGDAMQAGNLDINGGEFVFERTSDLQFDWKLSWSHCMMNSRDHTEIDQLRKVLSISPNKSQTLELGQRHKFTITRKRSARAKSDVEAVRRISWVDKTQHQTRSASLQRNIVSVT